MKCWRRRACAAALVWMSASVGGGACVAQTPAAARAATVSGTVKDATSAIVPGAKVELVSAQGRVVATGVSDSAGRFALPQPAAGAYTLRVTLDGFAPLTQAVRVGAVPVSGLALTLQVAGVDTAVNVNADEDVPLGSPDNNKDSASVTAADMKNLPVLDGDIVSTLTSFLSTDAAGEGGATLIIDGVEQKTLGVSPSAIERVSINQDPYSAQYRQPGRGQVEIVTKSVADRFHGSASFTYRNSALNATPNTAPYFTSTKQPEQRRLYEGYLTGPIKPLKDTGFLFSITRKELNAYSQILATTLPAPAAEYWAESPVRTTNVTLKVSHTFSEHHQAYVLYQLFDGHFGNQGIGGLTQESAGYQENNFDQNLTFHDDLTISPTLLNQFNLLFERNLDSTISNVEGPQYQVEGVATFGGAQQDQYNTENNPNLSDIVSWQLGKRQQLKFGVQIPNLGRRILEDKTDRQGTYTFGSAASYAAGQPVSFAVQQGQQRFQTLYAQPGAFFMDQIQVTPRLTVIPGVRYDYQNSIPMTTDAVQPHLSVAYVLDENHGMVLRVGGATYMRRVGVNVGQQIERYSAAAERSLLITNNAAACYPYTQVANCTGASQPPSLYEFAPGLHAPMQGYFGLSVERQITKKSTLTVGYEGFRGWHALRSLDLNAPLPPYPNTVRPNPNFAQVAYLDSGGYQKSDALNVSFRGALGKVFTGFAQYTYSHADANTQWSTFFPENQYAPNAEWSRTNYDERHKVAFFGTFFPEKPVTFGAGFYANTGQPYTETLGTDYYGTGLNNARPVGVPRNSLSATGSDDLELRLSYNRKLHPQKKDSEEEVQFSASSFNTLNSPNFGGFIGVVGSPKFEQPTSAGWPMRMQLSASYSF